MEDYPRSGTPAVSHRPSIASHAPPPRRQRWLGLLAFLAGLACAVLLLRQVPPPPPFSPQRARASYWQSYETAYFASLRSYEQLVQDVIDEGRVPVVVFGDSSIRGAGARDDHVWTRILERRLQAVNPRVRVLNFAQNAGDLLAPFLYHHLRQRFPSARYIVQWPFGSEVGRRHQFHFWLTSEIALRDGRSNPAVNHAYAQLPVKRTDERLSFILAGLNIATNCLDVGNWVRYRWLGRLEAGGDRNVHLHPLETAPEQDLDVTGFVVPDDRKTRQTMRDIFRFHLIARQKYLQRPLVQREAYLAEIYPPAVRSHLLLITCDMNPYYAPAQEAGLMQTWHDNWRQLRADLARQTDLNWVGLTCADGGLKIDDFCDLGHLTISGQQRLAEAVADKLLAPGGWFDSAAPGSESLPASLTGQWIEWSSVPRYQRDSFQFMHPQPVRFFSSFGPALDTDFYNAHPTTRLRFAVPPGAHRLRTTLRFAPGAYENLPQEQATDGITFEAALVDPIGRRTVLLTRQLAPWSTPADRRTVPVDLSFSTPTGTELEVSITPGPQGRDTRDWVSLGPLTID